MAGANWNRQWRQVGIAATAILLSACVSQSPVVKNKDGGPDREMDVSHIPDAVPRPEPRTRAGNSNPYTVLGKTYWLEEEVSGFRQKGYASWYGTKFHGLRTANGEIYDMYGMTAAHKTLPIPSYVRVTNQNNGRSVIVRINDRGPFHGDRIIDLTYTAAKKLGFHNQGTAPVEVEYIDPDPQPAVQVAQNQAEPQQAPKEITSTVEVRAPEPTNSSGYGLPANTFLQVGAFGSEAAARDLQARIRELTDYPVVITTLAVDNLLRVRVGPLKDNLDLMNLREKLLEAKFSEPHVVYD